MDPVFICAAKRTAVGSYQGSLASVSATELGAHVIRAVMEQCGLSNDTIDQVILGCILTAGVGQAPARQAALGAGLANTVQALTINKVCSSGLKAVMLAADAIQLGHAQSVLAGGMENMSQAPYLLPSMRAGARLGHVEAVDSIILDALWDVYNDYHMGCAGELCAREYKFTREMQDAFAIESYTRATNAIKQGFFQEEIVPILVKQKKKELKVDIDEEPARGNIEKIPQLRPVFEKEGTVTAANASPLNDGAAVLLVCSQAFQEKHKLTPLAKIVSQGWHAQAPEWFTTAPVGALRTALAKAELGVDNIDLFEINEAFSSVAMACSQELGIDREKLNIQGGAVALGHPLGASGAKILTTLLHSLKRLGLKRGAVGICNGGGEATALVVERL